MAESHNQECLDGKKDKFPVLNRESRCGPVGSLRGMLLFGALGDSGLCRGHHTSPRAPDCFPVRSERWQCTMAPPGWSWQNLAELAEPAAGGDDTAGQSPQSMGLSKKVELQSKDPCATGCVRRR